MAVYTVRVFETLVYRHRFDVEAPSAEEAQRLIQVKVEEGDIELFGPSNGSIIAEEGGFEYDTELAQAPAGNAEYAVGA